MHTTVLQVLLLLAYVHRAAGVCRGSSCCQGNGQPEPKPCQCFTNPAQGIDSCSAGETCDLGPGKCRKPKCQGGGQPEASACECGTTPAICAAGDTCDATGAGICTKPPSNSGPQQSGNQQSGGSAGAEAGDGCQNEPARRVCKDDLNAVACQAVFGGSGAQRKEKCAMTGLAQLALRCAKTCGICYETAPYGCGDDGVYGIDCQQHRHKCNDDVWRSVMSAACPHTCGLCHHGECRDRIDGCCAMKHLCRDYAYRSYLTLNCGKTCEACGNATESSDTNPTPLKGKQPRAGGPVRIVGQAPPAGPPVLPSSTCYDSGANCATMRASCRTLPVMRQYCPRTCGFC